MLLSTLGVVSSHVMVLASIQHIMKLCLTTTMLFVAIGEHPSLIELVRFRGRERRINIPQEISTKYRQFGILLLEDTNGARVRNMEHKHQRDAEQINTEILEEWVNGRGRQPVSWEILTEVLRDVKLGQLASDIEAVKLCTEL